MSTSSCFTNFTCSDTNSLILPIVNEATWRLEVRATVYLLGLLWSFMGVSIVADVFMTSIERITSSTKSITIFNADTGMDEQVEVKVWNDTVANLTLMALGSSAPEILLSIIEIVGNNFTAGELGPGTIVGSAAFNLLVISAVCVVSVGEEGRRIKQFKVFCVTASCSVLAYLWLVVILVLSTPDFVDLWEGVVTFLFFFILVVIAFLVDKQFCCKPVDDDGEDKEADHGIGIASTVSLTENNSKDDSRPRIDEEQMRKFLKSIGKDATLSEQELKQLVLKRFSDKMHHSRAWYRINATRQMMGGHKLEIQLTDKLQSKLECLDNEDEAVNGDSVASLRTQSALSENNKLAVIEFSSTGVAVLERDQRARLGIRRFGNLRVKAIVKIETVDGTATKNEDYVPLKKTIVFEPEETFQHIDIEIIDDNEWEPDENFFVKLSVEAGEKFVKLGPKKINQVTIINDDEPGTFEFENASHLFKESCVKACVPVRRVNGADGIATVNWKTEDQTARAGFDYEAAAGELVFNHGEIEKTIDIIIFDDQEKEKDEHFKLVLTDCSKGARLGKTATTIITLVNDDEYNGLVSRLAQAANLDLDSIRVDNNTYSEQIKQAMNVNGGDIDNATAIDYVMHFFTFFWKILFSLIPPPSIWGGWLCFIVSLGAIGLLTALVGDLASIFGCLVGLKDPVTAITFVALGTSLPDLFASKQAAQSDPTADNSIGNVTGSNSVNVFLGLGLPWMIAAIYHTSSGNSFMVKAGDLVFSVILYSICSMCALSLFVIRRYVKAFGNCELGGKASLKYATAAIMVSLWVLYILLSSFKAYNIIQLQL